MKTTTTPKNPSKSKLPRLSRETVNQLKDLRDQDDKQPFYALVVALRKNRWPLRAIADALGVSRSIVNIWETKLDPRTPIPEAEDLPEVINEQVKPIYMRYTIDEDEAVKLAVLTQRASKVRRFTAPNSPARLAAKELEERLYHHRKAGASLNTLRVACGVSRRAVAQRLEKYIADHPEVSAEGILTETEAEKASA
jgi:hypothetical protein